MKLGESPKNEDGKAYEVVTLSEGYVVILKEPTGAVTRRAAMTVGQVTFILREYGLLVGEEEAVH